MHKLTNSCQFQSGLRHTAHEQPFEVVIRYPHHPRAGECVIAYRRVVHADQLHYVIEDPDGCRLLLPAWMSETFAADMPTVEAPRLRPDALRALRSLVDALVVSSLLSSEANRTGERDEAVRTSSTTRPTRYRNKHDPAPPPRSHNARRDRGSSQAVAHRVQRRPGKGKRG